MIEQLIALVFATRNAAHLAHWRTKSFSQHMALNEFYDDVLEVLDNMLQELEGVYLKAIYKLRNLQ